MKNKIRRISHVSAGAFQVTTLVAVMLFWVSSVHAQGAANRVDRASLKSFSETLRTLENTLKSEGMMIVATIDHQNMLSMVGANIRHSTTVEFGKPAMGKMLLPMNLAIGLEMPARIYVYEAPDGKVIVSYRKVAPLFATYGNAEVAKAGEMMDMMLDKITSMVTH